MAAKHCLDLSASASLRWMDLGYGPPPAHDSELFAVVLHLVEETGEVPCGISSTHLGHRIRLSDCVTNVNQPRPQAPGCTVGEDSSGAR